MKDRLGDIRNPFDQLDENNEIQLQIEGDDEIKDEDMDTEELLLDQTQAEFDSIGNSINQILANSKAVMHLERRANSETTQIQHQEIMKALDGFIASTQKIAQQVSVKMKINKAKNDEYLLSNPHSTLAQWRINKLNTSALRFQKSMLAFNEQTHSFKQCLRTKIARQARLVNTSITEQQIEEIVESNDPTKFMQQALMIPDAMIDKVAQIEKKHEAILNIEKGIKELQEMWTNLAVLIDEQQEQLDGIEMNVEQTQNYVTKGRKNLEKARKSQKSARKMLACMFCFVIIVVLVLVLFLAG